MCGPPHEPATLTLRKDPTVRFENEDDKRSEYFGEEKNVLPLLRNEPCTVQLYLHRTWYLNKTGKTLAADWVSSMARLHCVG